MKLTKIKGESIMNKYIDVDRLEEELKKLNEESFELFQLLSEDNEDLDYFLRLARIVSNKIKNKKIQIEKILDQMEKLLKEMHELLLKLRNLIGSQRHLEHLEYITTRNATIDEIEKILKDLKRKVQEEESRKLQEKYLKEMKEKKEKELKEIREREEKERKEAEKRRQREEEERRERIREEEERRYHPYLDGPEL